MTETVYTFQAGTGMALVEDADAKTLTVKFAAIATLCLLGNATGGTIEPVALSASDVRTMLSITNVDNVSVVDYAEPVIAASTSSKYWRGDKTWQTLNKAAVGLGSVENTALSTWAGTTNITTLGTIASGTWQGTAVADSYIASATAWNAAAVLAVAAEPAIAASTSSKYWRGDKTWQTLDKTAVGLPNVENTALSTWAGTSNITTVGAVAGTSLVVGHTGLLAVGASGYTGILQAHSTGTGGAIVSMRHSNDSAGGILQVGKSRGAVGTPTALSALDDLGALSFVLSDGSDYANTGAQIKAIIQEAATTTAQGTDILFNANRYGGASLNEIMRLHTESAATIHSLIFGHTATVQFNNTSTAFYPAIQVHGTTNSTGSIGSVLWSNGTSGNFQVIGHSRSGTKGTFSALSSADKIGMYGFVADDGVGLYLNAGFQAYAAEAQSATNHGTDIGVMVVANGVATAAAETTRFMNSGEVIFGTTAAYTFGAAATSPRIQVHRTTDAASIGVGRWSSNTSPARFYGIKARAGIGTFTACNSGDEIVSFEACPADGTDASQTTAKMSAWTTEATTTTQQGTELRFYTTPVTTATLTESVRICDSGDLVRIPNVARVTTQFDKTSSAALANVTGLSVNVVAGKTYSFTAKLFTTSNASGGVQAAIGGTCTATTIVYEGIATNAATVAAQGRGAALAASVAAVTAVTAAYIEISGTIIVNAAGTLTVQFAQNASNVTASSVLVGSSFIVERLNT